MKIWESILYAIVGGITELLPISFSGHAAVLQNMFHMTPLTQGGGYYIRVAITIGIILAIILAFPSEAGSTGQTLRILRRPRRGEKADRLQARTLLVSVFALIPMLCSLFFLASAERMTRLLYVAGFFALNGSFIYFCCRGAVGQRMERDITIVDTVSIGLVRMLCVFPGLSSVSASLCIGRVRGLQVHCNARLAYLLTLAFHIISLIYHLPRALIYGSLSGTILLAFVLSALFAAVFGYLALQYFRYLLERKKLNFFSYYCWDAAVITLILSIINA